MRLRIKESQWKKRSEYICTAGRSSRLTNIPRLPGISPEETEAHQVSVSRRKPNGIALEDGAHSSSVSVPIHKSRYSLQAFPRLINPGLFIYATFVNRTKRHSLFVPKAFFPLNPLSSASRSSLCIAHFTFLPSKKSSSSFLEIKGLTRPENLNQKTHRAMS